MSNIDTLLNICEALEQKHIEPSVAMLRAKSSQPVALPLAVKAIQQYKSGVRALKSNASQSENKTSANHRTSIEERVAQLELENKSFRQKLDQLETKLARLTLSKSE
jgi:uncharacterized protein YceH (UPF0502 family)